MSLGYPRVLFPTLDQHSLFPFLDFRGQAHQEKKWLLERGLGGRGRRQRVEGRGQMVEAVLGQLWEAGEGISSSHS